MKKMKSLAFALLALAITCNAQTRKELLLTGKYHTEGTLSDFIEKYLLDQEKRSGDKSDPKISIVDDKKEIEMSKELGGDSYLIPVKKEEFIKGDFTGDKIPDIIINVGRSFGASGHNTISFMFIGTSKGYTFIKTFDSVTLAQCTREGAKWGEFDIEEIKGNRIIGTAACYTDNDAKCCPSKKYSSVYQYDVKSQNIVFVSQTEKR